MNNFRAERMVVSTSVHFKKYWSYSALFWCCCRCSLVVMDNCATGSCKFYSNILRHHLSQARLTERCNHLPLDVKFCCRSVTDFFFPFQSGFAGVNFPPEKIKTGSALQSWQCESNKNKLNLHQIKIPQTQSEIPTMEENFQSDWQDKLTKHKIPETARQTRRIFHHD